MVTEASSKIKFNYEYLHEQHEVDRVITWLEGQKFFAFDLETDGTNAFHNKTILLQIGNKDKQWIIDTRQINIEPLRPFFEDKKIIKLGQNLKFDLRFLLRKDWNVKNLVDTMLQEQIIRCGLHVRVSLEALAYHYLRIALDKEEELRQSFGTTAVNQFSERQLEYAAGDVIYPEYIARLQKSLIDARGLRNTVDLENAVLPVLAKMEHVGMRLDTNSWIQLYHEAVEQRKVAEKQLDRFFGAMNLSQGDFFGEAKVTKTLNYNSPKQILKALNKLGYVDVEDTDSNTLALLAIDGRLPREFVEAMVAYRIYMKRESTYGLNIIDMIEPETGNIHSEFTQAFTTTGRLSSTKPNVQNMPRNVKYRKCFIPHEGYVYIVWDLKAIEPRILGDMSLDPTYIKAFTHNLDIYSLIGKNIYHEEVGKAPGRPAELRAKAKVGVLGTSYGTGKEKFHQRLLLDLNRNEEGFLQENLQYVARADSDLLWEGIFETCPKIRQTLDQFSSFVDPINSDRTIYDERAGEEPYSKAYHAIKDMLVDKDGNPYDPRMSKEKIEQIAKERAKKRSRVTYAITLNGRKRLFKCYHKSWWTDGRNAVIQGTAADILKKAMVLVHDRIEQEGHDAVIVNQAHDELIVMAKKEQAEEVNQYVQELMEEAGNSLLRAVPCLAEGGIRSCWEKD